MTTYVKFINLFPEIKTVIEGVFSLDSNIRSADAELQQRACEYLALSKHATLDVLATVLEEMPPFPEKGKLNEIFVKTSVSGNFFVKTYDMKIDFQLCVNFT